MKTTASHGITTIDWLHYTFKNLLLLLIFTASLIQSMATGTG